ncbi:uncharacterized protein CLUP02_14059 [Colletotrichum lupini]|uniref:Uncharacterized protein n=1 Tax=Colletotrichum lupini TaxID=145971 RepID=A0A9Q8T3H7_9PEZI|nr:uncharacterized protein CLUP02_14059 [Colletotrichum lupini]UQC88534.1 hypothetical protein CLUP02_14059 [Colletotrichum lupini]
MRTAFLNLLTKGQAELLYLSIVAVIKAKFGGLVVTCSLSA